MTDKTEEEVHEEQLEKARDTLDKLGITDTSFTFKEVAEFNVMAHHYVAMLELLDQHRLDLYNWVNAGPQIFNSLEDEVRTKMVTDYPNLLHAMSFINGMSSTIDLVYRELYQALQTRLLFMFAEKMAEKKRLEEDQKVN